VRQAANDLTLSEAKESNSREIQLALIRLEISLLFHTWADELVSAEGI